MRRIRLTVAYDGTNYKGWQVQSTGVTIEQRLNEALAELLAPSRREVRRAVKEELECGSGEDAGLWQQRIEKETERRYAQALKAFVPPEVIGASRTDSGVHARGNIAVFDTDSRIPAEKFALALNQKLPEDIRIVRSDEVAPDWHPRRQHGVKTYEYCYYNAPVPDPMRRLYSHYVHLKVDVERMREAAQYLLGEHDFRSFCNPDAQVLKNGGSAVRTIYAIELARSEDGMIRLRVQGNGFLYHMVRIIAGTLLKVGTGQWPPEQVKTILEKQDRCFAGPTAPACGLVLVSLAYFG